MDSLPDCVLKKIFMFIFPYDCWFTDLGLVCKIWSRIIHEICRSGIYGLEFWGQRAYVVQLKKNKYGRSSIFYSVDFPIMVNKFDTFLILLKLSGPHLQRMHIVVTKRKSDIKNCKKLLKAISMYAKKLTSI